MKLSILQTEYSNRTFRVDRIETESSWNNKQDDNHSNRTFRVDRIETPRVESACAPPHIQIEHSE